MASWPHYCFFSSHISGKSVLQITLDGSVFWNNLETYLTLLTGLQAEQFLCQERQIGQCSLSTAATGAPQFELQFAFSGRTFPGGMPRRMSSPGGCFGVSLAGGNGGCGMGSYCRGCWQSNRIGPCCIFIRTIRNCPLRAQRSKGV